MPDKHLYEYSVIRVVPVVEREEFINVGVIVLCKKEKFIKLMYKIDDQKLRTFSPNLDIELVKESLAGFEKTALGIANGGAISALDAHSRFRWLTAVRSSSLQTSRPHPGLTDDLDKTLHRLFREFV